MLFLNHLSLMMGMDRITDIAAMNEEKNISLEDLNKKAHARITGKGLYFFYQRLRHEGLIERNPNLELTA